MAKPLGMKYVWGLGNALKVSTRNRMRPILCIWPGSCTTRSVLHVRTERARRRAVRPDRCAATVSATRLGVICLVPRRIGARSPAAHPLDDARRSATARNNAPFGNLVGSRMRMRAACSITRSPILIRHSRMVANSAWLPAHQALSCRGGQNVSIHSIASTRRNDRASEGARSAVPGTATGGRPGGMKIASALTDKGPRIDPYDRN
jgi:hypothetical protein